MQLLAAIALVTACRTASTPSPSTSATTPPATERHTHENLNGLLWMQTAAEYHALALQAYRLATVQLDAAVRDRHWTAAVEQTGDPSSLPPAVVLDLDETVLDNSAFEARRISNGDVFSEEKWNQWCEERTAKAIPGSSRVSQACAGDRREADLHHEPGQTGGAGDPRRSGEAWRSPRPHARHDPRAKRERMELDRQDRSTPVRLCQLPDRVAHRRQLRGLRPARMGPS